MTNKQSHENGIISDAEINWLVRRAKDGFGIITTAAANVSKDGQGWEGEIGVYSDIHIARLKILTSKIAHYGSLSIAQIFHGGMRSPENLTGKTPLSPSVNKCKESVTGLSKACSQKDILRLIKDFSNAAVRCALSKFNGIELHGAHGYLISQFLGKKTNRRKDEWGGTFKNRSRFLLQLLRKIKEQVPKNFLIGVRISPEIEDIGISIGESIKLVKILKNEGVDFIHLSCWDVFKNSSMYPKSSKTLTELFFDSINDLPPIISTGGVWSSKDARELLKQGPDFVGVGRVGIAHPNWACKISNKNYDPKRPPYSSNYLSEVGLSVPFINYMRNWKGFVSEV